MEYLGGTIRYWREKSKMSQSVVENHTGIKRGYLSKLENNELKNPTYNTICKLCNAFHISLPVFFGGVNKNTDDELLDAMLDQLGQLENDKQDLAAFLSKIKAEVKSKLNEMCVGEAIEKEEA